jgi:hypothetical protein
MSGHNRRRGSLSAAAPITASRSPHASGNSEHPLIDENDIPMEELQEFMAADFFEVPADPAFKNRLREKLWELVESNAFGYGPHNKD